MPDPDLLAAIAETVATVTANPTGSAAHAAPTALAAEFRTQRTSASIRARVEAEDEIWAHWYRHPGPDLERRMDTAIAAMASRDMATAVTLIAFDVAVRLNPNLVEIRRLTGRLPRTVH